MWRWSTTAWRESPGERGRYKRHGACASLPYNSTPSLDARGACNVVRNSWIACHCTLSSLQAIQNVWKEIKLMKDDYDRHLIEVSLPLKAISAQSAREKSIRHEHISTVHI